MWRNDEELRIVELYRNRFYSYVLEQSMCGSSKLLRILELGYGKYSFEVINLPRFTNGIVAKIFSTEAEFKIITREDFRNHRSIVFAVFTFECEELKLNLTDGEYAYRITSSSNSFPKTKKPG